MKNFIIRWIINTAGIILVAKIVPGIEIAHYKSAIIAALILGLLNAFIKPFIIIITLPINILSLGIFTLFINTFMFYASSKFVEGFIIAGFWDAFTGALCLSVISFMLNIFAGPLIKVKMGVGRQKPRSNPVYHDAIDIEIVPPKDEPNKESKDKNLLS